MNKKFYIFTIIMAVVLFVSKNLNAEVLSVDDIIDTTLERTEFIGTESIRRLIIRDNRGNKKERKIAQITKLYQDKEGTQKSLMRFLTPADVKGSGFLNYDYKSDKDNDQWLYLPSLRKVRKIVSSEKSNSFMGSEFTYADISRLKKIDFNFKLISEKKINGELCWEIEERPVSEDKEDEYGFYRKVVYISKTDFVIRKAEIYDLDDELYKEMIIKNIFELDKENSKFVPTHIVITNLENNRVSELITDKIVLNKNVKDDYFTFRYLQRN